MLLHYQVTPLIVFDGARMPAKSETERRRAAQRQRNRELGIQALSCGELSTAQSFLQRAVDVTPDMAHEVIKALRAAKVDYVVAPYEADAQLAMLSREGLIDLVITEDSDLVIYGAKSVFFKIDRYGYGDHFEQKNLGAVSNPNLLAFNPDMLLFMCILAGCDFFAGIPKMGIRRAHSFVLKCRRPEQILHAVRTRGLYENISEFEHGFRRAIFAFRHHRVYDPRVRRLVCLNPLPPGVQDSDAASIIGPNMEPHVAVKIATAEWCPLRLAPFAAANGQKAMSSPLTDTTSLSKRGLSRTGGRAFWKQIEADWSRNQSRILPGSQRTNAMPIAVDETTLSGVGGFGSALLDEKTQRSDEARKKVCCSPPSRYSRRLSKPDSEIPEDDVPACKLSHETKFVPEEQLLCSLCSSVNSQPYGRDVAPSTRPNASPDRVKTTLFLYENDQQTSSFFVQNTPEQNRDIFYSPSIASSASPK
jgi:hypothetical protein